ncbi:hypothetical protein ACJMK2_012417 [Sinanodonta woodiana]|uniref:Cadherin domain-containing protein n=1 Tax=Sinanodonta woodiana TaxID=1069815 RepID=A0ABD3V850_SINWO
MLALHKYVNIVDDEKCKAYRILGKGYLIDSTSYDFNCCGVIEKWEAFLNRTGTISYQVWRPISGSTYKLVGENLWTNGSDMVTYTTSGWGGGWGGGGGWSPANGNNMMSTGDLSVGVSLSWSSATVYSSRSYGIKANYISNSSPYFTNLPTLVTISKDQSVGNVLHTVSFTDSNPDDVLGLIVTLTTTSVYFSFDNNTNQVSVAGSLTNAVGTYALVFKVKDICPTTATATLTITVTNQPPVINNLPSSAELSEDSTTETLLYTINATDANPTDTVTCSLATSGVPFLVRQKAGSSYFGIYVKSSANFSYDIRNTYALSISCSDGLATVSSTFTVYLLRNQPPVITNLASSVLVSSKETSGYIVFTVTSSDPEGDQLYYSMTCNPSACPFQILGSGVIQLTSDLKNITATGYDISVRVYDGRTYVGPKILTVIITGINSAPTITNLPLASNLSVAEGTALGTSVFAVSVSDLNIGDNHTFTMTSTPGSGMNYFSISSSTGVVYTSTNNIDYESIPSSSYNLLITVSDGTDQTAKILAIAITNVNEAPSFAQSLYSISTNEASRGTLLPDPGFVISDPDTGDSRTFSSNCGNATGYFTMSTSTGRLNFSTNYDVDQGLMPSSVLCNVTVTDAGGLTGTTSLLIKINDVNDNYPVFIPSTYSFYASYYAATATTIGIVTVSDADSGTYGTVTLALNQTSLGSEYFGITSKGEIYTQKSILATDGGGLVTTANVTIAISVSTTVLTTLTVTSYRTFIQDGRNVAWISLSGIIAVVIVIVFFWILCKINREGAPKFDCRR